MNHELELLKIQLNKVNQLLNDTIVEKCKQELNYQSIEAQHQKSYQDHQQYNTKSRQEPILNPNLNPMQQYKIKTYFDSRTNLNDSLNQKSDNSLNNTSIWKQPTPQKNQQSQYYFASLVDTNNKNVEQQLDSRIQQQPPQQHQYFSNNHRTLNNSNTRDMVREKRRASIGKVPYNYNTQPTHNDNKPSAMERLFGSHKNLDQFNAIKKIAMVKPEMRNEDTAFVFKLEQ